MLRWWGVGVAIVFIAFYLSPFLPERQHSFSPSISLQEKNCNSPHILSRLSEFLSHSLRSSQDFHPTNTSVHSTLSLLRALYHSATREEAHTLSPSHIFLFLSHQFISEHTDCSLVWPSLSPQIYERVQRLSLFLNSLIKYVGKSRELNTKAKNTTVVVIGGGPVGLLSAIEAYRRGKYRRRDMERYFICVETFFIPLLIPAPSPFPSQRK